MQPQVELRLKRRTGEKTIEYYEQALAIQREVKNRAGEGAVLGGLGAAYGVLSRDEKAIEYYEQALAISREIKDLVGEGSMYGALGNAYTSRKHYEKAIEQFEKALVIFREIKDFYSEGSALCGLGDAYKSLSRYEQAIKCYEQALAISRQIKNLQGEGSTLSALGDAYTSLSRYEKAIEHFDLALPHLREARDRAGEAETLYRLARAERGQGNLVAARTRIEESLKIGELLRAEQIISPESRAAFLANTQSRYQFYTDLLMRQHQAEPTKGFDALAVEVSERQRARSLLDLLTEARADVREGVDAALLERERLLDRQLKDKAQRLLKANTPEQAAALKQESSQIENDYERAQAAIRKASPHYAALTQPQPLKFGEIQQQLDADTLLLEYALGEEHSYLWAITKDSLKSYELPKEEQIKQNALQVQELLTARSVSKRGETALQRRNRITQAEAQLPAAAAALSQMLLAPVAAELGNKRLVIVPDGALQYVPFAMLPKPVVRGQGSGVSEKNSADRPPATDHRPLIVEHEIISLSSASTLAIQRPCRHAHHRASGGEVGGWRPISHPAPALHPARGRTDSLDRAQRRESESDRFQSQPRHRDERRVRAVPLSPLRHARIARQRTARALGAGALTGG